MEVVGAALVQTEEAEDQALEVETGATEAGVVVEEEDHPSLDQPLLELDQPLLDSAPHPVVVVVVVVVTGVVVVDDQPFSLQPETRQQRYVGEEIKNRGRYGPLVVVEAVVVVAVVVLPHPLALSEDQAGDATARALRPRTTIDLYMVVLFGEFCCVLKERM